MREQMPAILRIDQTLPSTYRGLPRYRVRLELRGGLTLMALSAVYGTVGHEVADHDGHAILATLSISTYLVTLWRLEDLSFEALAQSPRVALDGLVGPDGWVSPGLLRTASP